MARKAEWQQEIEDALKFEPWAQGGRNRLMKAVPLERSVVRAVRGFVTLERSLLGRDPRQLEIDLGLPAGLFARGCRIYRLLRLPRFGEIEYELTAEFPDGLAFDESSALNAVILRNLGRSTAPVRIYGPGNAAIHQWRLTAEIPAAVETELLPGFAYSY